MSVPPGVGPAPWGLGHTSHGALTILWVGGRRAGYLPSSHTRSEAPGPSIRELCYFFLGRCTLTAARG